MDLKMHRWSNDNVIKLIQMYEHKCRLWSSGNNGTDRIEKGKSIGEIAEAFKCSTEEIERKVRSLKSQYHREKRLLLNNTKSNAAATKVPWFAYNYLRFLDVKSPPDEDASSLSLTSNNHIKIQIQGKSQILKLENEESLEPEMEIRGLDHTVRPTSVNAHAEANEEQLIEQPVPPAEAVDPAPAKSINGPHFRDEFDVFGEIVSYRIRRLKDRKRICVLQHAIESAIFEAEMAEFDNENMS